MAIKLPSQAEEYFNKQAEKLLSFLQPATPRTEPSKPKEQSSSSHAFAQTISKDDIIDLSIIGTVDGFGKELSKYFQTQQGIVGLEGDKYVRFKQLIEKLSNRAELKMLLSEEFIKASLFEWFEKRYKGELNQSTSFIDTLEERAAKEVKAYKISIPISYLSVEKPFSVGKVLFDFNTKEFFDRIELRLREKTKGERSGLDEGIRHLRKRYQGAVFSSLSVHAEKGKGIEIAKEETENALMILRLFSPSTFVPEIPSYTGMMGKVSIPSTYLFIFEGDWPDITEEIDEGRNPMWHIREADIQEFRRIGLDHASDLITKERRSHLESLLMKSIFLFTHGIIAKSFEDKLVFILASIETLLLKDSTEPIQTSVGLRLSFLSESTADKRKQVIDLVKDAYKNRSGYLHHGQSKGDVEILRKLQHAVWTGLTNILRIRNRFSSQEELLRYIEGLILS